MKMYINVILFLVFQFSYTQFSNQSNIATNSFSANYDLNHEDTLINDYIKLDFDVKNAKVTFDFVSEDTKGTIGGLEFKASFNPDNTDNASFKGTALVNTIDTGNFLRDGHLMWEKFFNKKEFPKISFESTEIVHFENNHYKMIGNLTIKGSKKEVIITFDLTTSKLIGKTTIYTSDYGINIHDEREKNKLLITFDFPIIK